MLFEETESLFKRELAGEAASNLGRVGRKVEATLAALRANPGDAGLLELAAEAVYNYMVQRELNGLTNEEEAIRLYAIPPEVVARLGAR